METVTTYVPPEILSEIDDDATHQTMLSNLPADIDKTEGGFAHDFTRPAALEKAEIMLTMNEVCQIIFPEWATGSWLDKHAFSAGLTRRNPTYAEAELTITGEIGTLIPQGFIFATAETDTTPSIRYETLEPTVMQGESEKIRVRCTQAGTVGNVPEHSILLMDSTLQGIKTITNEEAAAGGSEEESDESLRSRILDIDINKGVSFVGNDADYKRWAQEVDGVGTATVVPEWQGAGTGTVQIIIMGADGLPANPTLINAVYNHIMAPDNRSERLAPIGAILTVSTAESTDISVTAKVILDPGANTDAVTELFKKNLATYFIEAKEENCVVYTRIASALSETQGVFDYTELKVNGATTNIPLEVAQYPRIAAVTIEEADG